MMKILRFAAITVVVTFISGCAGFQSNKLPPLEEYKLDIGNNEKTILFASVEAKGSSILANSSQFGAVQEREIKDYIVETGCCVLTDGTNEPDVIIRIKSVNHTNAAALIPAFITGFTLYTVPSWITEKVDFNVDVEGADGRTKNYDMQDSAVFVQWLPMIFAYPFQGGPVATREKLMERVSKNLVKNLHDDGFITVKE